MALPRPRRPSPRTDTAMTTDVSAALATLQLHPEDSQALKALAAVHPGNGAGIDADVLSKALSDARRFHRERGDYELVRLAASISSWPGRPRPRAAPTCFTRRGGCCSTSCCATRPARPPCARRWTAAPGTRRRRSRWRRCRWCAPTGSRSRSDTCSRPRARRIRRWRPASTDRSPSSTSSTAPRTARARRTCASSLELDAHNRRSGYHFERLLREKGATTSC